MNIVRVLVLCILTILNVQGYVDLSIGPNAKSAHGDSKNYDFQPGMALEASLGKDFGAWDLAVEAMYSYNRANDLRLDFRQGSIQDDFHWQSFKVGPTVKYRLQSEESNYSWAPFLGAFLDYNQLQSSREFIDSQTQDEEDAHYHNFGYGLKTGVQFKIATPKSTWLDHVSYKVYATYTKHRRTLGDFQNASSRIQEYRGDTPDNLTDYSVGLLVGYSFGEKTFSWVRSLCD